MACALCWLTGCARPLRATMTWDTRPLSAPELDTEADGNWLLSMNGAQGTQVEALPNGDVLLAGHADVGFVQLLSSQGDLRWTLPLSGCEAPRIATGDGQALYVVVEGLAGVGKSAPRNKWDSRCAEPSVATTLLRVDRAGNVAWKAEVPGHGWLIASKEQTVLVTSSEGTTRLTSFDPGGKVRWRQTEPGSFSLGAWSHEQRRFLLGGGRMHAGGTCEVASFDAKTGQRLWQTTVRQARSREWCRASELLVWRDTALLITALDNDPRLSAVSAETGARRWERSFDQRAPDHPPYPPARQASRFPVTATQEVAPDGWNQNHVIVDIDPADGRASHLARLIAETSDVRKDEAVWVNAVVARDGVLLVTGAFVGRLQVGDAEAEASVEIDQQCFNIDPGYGPFYERPPKCSHGIERFRVLLPALFLARIRLR